MSGAQEDRHGLDQPLRGFHNPLFNSKAQALPKEPRYLCRWRVGVVIRTEGPTIWYLLYDVVAPVFVACCCLGCHRRAFASHGRVIVGEGSVRGA